MIKRMIKGHPINNRMPRQATRGCGGVSPNVTVPWAASHEGHENRAPPLGCGRARPLFEGARQGGSSGHRAGRVVEEALYPGLDGRVVEAGGSPLGRTSVHPEGTSRFLPEGERGSSLGASCSRPPTLA
jgi:hypothetical protein